MKNNIVEVTYGTDLIDEIDSILIKLKINNMISSIIKEPRLDSIKYKISFKTAEGAFYFGLSRPQIKL